jgi:putative Holliday junction resolvase
MVILSVDLGKMRTGIAISDKNEFLASPLTVITSDDNITICNKIKEIIDERNAKKIVLGLPKNMDGTEGESAANARAFSDLLSKKTGLDVILIDERLTTVLANKHLNASNKCGKKRKEVIDSVSAVLILQSYLDRK